MNSGFFEFLETWNWNLKKNESGIFGIFGNLEREFFLKMNPGFLNFRKLGMRIFFKNEFGILEFSETWNGKREFFKKWIWNFWNFGKLGTGIFKKWIRIFWNFRELGTEFFFFLKMNPGFLDFWKLGKGIFKKWIWIFLEFLGTWHVNFLKNEFGFFLEFSGTWNEISFLKNESRIFWIFENLRIKEWWKRSKFWIVKTKKYIWKS